MSLGDRLNQARQRRFVGRDPERALFAEALGAAELPFQVLYIYGPGGVGKTTLLQEFGRMCEDAGIPKVYWDARYWDPGEPEGLIRALEEDLRDHTGIPQRRVWLLDTYEMLRDWDDGLRERVLPQLSTEHLVVLAGRDGPSAGWRSDSGWQLLLREVRLDNLTQAESQDYLARLGIPEAEQDAMIAFTHGHPLALALVADVMGQRQGQIALHADSIPDVVTTLLERFVEDVPSLLHRRALEGCGLVRLTTEALLGQLLEIEGGSLSAEQVHELFGWLQTLSFMELGQRGIFPHDLVREVLCAELKWRDPDQYVALHHRARDYYSTRLQSLTGAEQQRLLLDFFFLHRESQAIRFYFQWQGGGNLSCEPWQMGDRQAVLQIVERFEGEASAALADYWLGRQPQGTLVLRDPQGKVAGVLMTVGLHGCDEADRQRDPAVAAALGFLQAAAPLRQGEGAAMFRFWAAHDTYQSVSAAQSLIFVNMIRYYRTTPGLAYTFIPCAQPQFWLPMFQYADMQRIPAADFEVGGRTYGVYGHDWRVVPPEVWQAMLAQREIDQSNGAGLAQAPMGAGVAILSQADFEQGIRDALKAYPYPEKLASNRLLQSRLVRARAGDLSATAERVAALQGLIRETAETLRGIPRQERYFQTLLHAYLQPALTQEQAAEILDLPFSTFRRYLKAGITYVIERLWQQELGEG